jgi:ABC-type multidrug transport system fused ATPase/permease subunit
LAKDFLHAELHQTLQTPLFFNQTSLRWNSVSSISIKVDPLPIGRFPSAEEHPMFYVAVFACIGLGVVVINIAAQIVLAVGSYRASRRLFKDLLETVMKATMRWFDTTPTGN